MKKRMMILLVCMAMMLTACGSNQADTKQDEKPQADIVIEKPDLGHVDEAEAEEKDDAADDRVDDSCPGPDVVYLVNLRGDESTAYKLVDGTYMDRIERRFTYNGTDTWTDEDGVEWNEKVN